MRPDLILNLVLFVLGVAFGWGITHVYAHKASGQLQKIAQAFAEIAEGHGLVEWKRDAKGRITFFRIIRLSVDAAKLVLRPVTAAGEGKVTPKPDDPRE